MSHVRTQLQDSKGKWMERINALESQIAKLNGKLSEDTHELQQEVLAKQQVTEKLEKQVQEARLRWRESEDRVVQLEAQNADLQRQGKRWHTRCEQLEAEQNSHSESLRDQLDQLTAEKAVDRKSQVSGNFRLLS